MPSEYIHFDGTPESIVGEYVYIIGQPQKIGRVVGTETTTGPKFGDRVWAVVKWSDGSKTNETPSLLKSIESLIADHEKKLNTHRNNLEKAKLVIG